MERRQFLSLGALSASMTGAALLGRESVAAAAPAPKPDAGESDVITARTARPVPVQPSLLGPTGVDSPKVGGNYGNQNNSSLKDIRTGNVKRLGGAWHINLEGGDTTKAQQCSIVAEHGVLYVQTTQQNIFAVNGKTGKTKWKTNVGTETTNMRGVGLSKDKIFTTSGDNFVHALDKKTGKIVWSKELLLENTDTGDGTCDPTQGQCGGSKAGLAGAIVYWDGLIYVGMEGSTQGARGRAYALDAETGEIEWLFWGAPGPGEYGNDTWQGDSWKTGGAVTWIHPAIDPETSTVYWTFGNPYPRTDGSGRGGDNLFCNCLLALDAKTGKRKWHFQSVHHDIWDWDNVMAPVLADIKVDGKKRKIVVYGSKVGYYYILDRTTGEPIQGVDEIDVPQDARQKTSKTQPLPRGTSFVPPQPQVDNATKPVPFYPIGGLFEPHWDRAKIIFPGAGGGADWAFPSFSSSTGLVYVGYGLINSSYSNARDGRVNTARPYGEYFAGGMAAIDPRTNTLLWHRDSEWSLAHGNGVLSTAGRLLFQGRPDGILAAMDDITGEDLWTFQCGAGVNSVPVSYEVDGEQYVAVIAGGNGLPYPDIPKGDHVWAFKLGGKVGPAPAPKPPSKRNDIRTAAVAGSKVNNTVALGRTWNTTTGAPATTENLVSTSAMAPQVLTIARGDTVTFSNPADNASAHGAASFFEYEFDAGVLLPGQSYQHTFDQAGTFFYNDPIYPQSTGKIVVL